MRTQSPFLYGFILVVFAVLQNTLLTPLQISQVRPEFTLLLLVFFAHQRGSMEGMIFGFITGIVIDLLGIAPLGFHSLIYTVIGHIFGLSRGKIYVDAITMPVIFAVAATLLSILTALVITLLFLPLRIASVLSVSSLIQLGMHALSAPFIFGILRVSKLCRERDAQML